MSMAAPQDLLGRAPQGQQPIPAPPATATPEAAPPIPQEMGESQLDLWDADQEERQAAIVRAVREGRSAADSGKIVLADFERARMLVKLRMLGYSYREISRRTGADPRTVKAVEVELRRQGKLPAEREELAEQFGEIARVSNEKLLEALDKGKVPPNVLPVAAGVATDKRAMLLGEAAGTVVNMQVNVNLDLVAGLKAAIQAAMGGKTPGTAGIDVESNVRSINNLSTTSLASARVAG